MNDFRTVIEPCTNKDGTPVQDEAGRNLYGFRTTEEGKFHSYFCLPHAAIVGLVQSCLATVPAEDPQPQLVAPPPKRHA